MPHLRVGSARVLVVCLFLVVAAAPAWAQADLPSSTGLRPDGSSATAPANAPNAPGAPQVERISSGLNAPVLLAFDPDGRLHYGEWKTGDVYPVGADGKPVAYGSPVLDVGEPAWGAERGFLGLAIGPDRTYYTFVTYEKSGGDGWFNRVSKWKDGQETVLLDNLPAGDWHNSGRIFLDPSGEVLWVAYGDVNTRPAAQDLDDPRGSILRMTTDGEPAEGNIAPGSFIWSYGHRQVFGFAIDWSTGRVMAAENMDAKNDEINFVRPGGNYGWPTCEGPCDPPRAGLEDPVVYYPQPIGPTSGAWFNGDFYFGTFNTGQIHRIYQDPTDDKWYDEVVHKNDKGPVIDLKPGPEGNTLYYSTWNEIWRLTFPDIEPDATHDAPVPDPALPDDGGDADIEDTSDADADDAAPAADSPIDETTARRTSAAPAATVLAFVALAALAWRPRS